MNANYVVQILEGDYTATYTIYYDSVDSSNIATLLGSNLPAEGISLTDMLVGVRISIPGSSSLVLLVGDGYCKSTAEFSVTPIEPPVTAPDLCMRFITDNVLNSWLFTPNSTENGKTKWQTTQNNKTYSIIWNPLVSPNRWEMQFETSVKFISTNTSDIPTSSWSIQGFSDVYDSVSNLNVLEGICPTVEPLNTDVIAESNICAGSTSCSGIITIVDTVGGTPPYSYQLDNLSETTTTIFENVCAGIHTVTTTDSNGLTTSDQVTIDRGITPVTYTLSIEKTNRVITNTIDRNVERSDWKITIVPELVAGSSVSFDLVSRTTQTVSKPGTGNFNYINNVYLDSVFQTPSSEQTITSTILRDAPCQTFNNEITNIEKVYSIVMTQGTTLSGFSVSELIIPQGSAQSINGCVTVIEQGIRYEYRDARFLGPCSNFDTPKGNSVIGNTLTATVVDCCPDGYVQVGDICELTTDVINGPLGTSFNVITGEGGAPQNGTIFYSNVTNLKKPLTFANTVVWNPATSATTGVELATSPNCESKLVDGNGFYNADGSINSSSFSVISRTFGYYDVNLRGIPVNKQVRVTTQNTFNGPWYGSTSAVTAWGNSSIRAQLPDGRTNLNQWFGVKYCFTSTVSQTYHLFLAADDTFSVKLDGDWLVKRLNIDSRTPSQYTTQATKIPHSLAADGILDNSVATPFQSITISWNHVIPITIPAGEHTFEFAFSDVFNYGESCCTAASFELYTGVTTAQLTGMTSYSQLAPYTAFSTRNLRNTEVQVIGNYGDDFGISCPPGYTLDGLCETPFCVKRQAKSC
jgi:hypothetical protein